MTGHSTSTPLCSTGIQGLDDILGGGLPAHRSYLIEGNPGAGKTTLAMQFLLAGAHHSEKCVYVTLSETRAELEASAASHDWSLEKIRIVELTASEDELRRDNQLAMFQPSELELGSTLEVILKVVEEVGPTRVVIDSLSEFRLLAQSSLRYRRQILALKQFFAGRRCTVLFLDDRTSDGSDLQLQSIAHGVLMLEQMAPEYGGERRRLRMAKLRGRPYREGFHDYVIEEGGLRVFPALVAAEHVARPEPGRLISGIDGLEQLVGGGFEHGTSVLIAGPAGCGKSTLALQYVFAAATRGERSLVLMFDEREETLLGRAEGLSVNIRPFVAQGLIKLQPVDPAQLSPGQLSQIIRSAVDGTDGGPPARVVVVDSLNGYLHAMPEERFLAIQLHELLTYLGHQSVVTFLVLAQHGLIGTMDSPVDATYLADSVILLRYFEAFGDVRLAISVVKKRSGPHERSIRELRMDSQGIRVGDSLKAFHGILTGTPNYVGDGGPLLEGRQE